MDADQSAAKRTDLAGERTMLAWWRTALASLAVALAVGRFLPEIATVDHSWPYVLLGLGFAAYAAGLFVFGAMVEELDANRSRSGASWQRFLGRSWRSARSR